jgi:hypothetical protein
MPSSDSAPHAPLWLWPYRLGVDGVIVALIWQYALAMEHVVRVRWEAALALGLAVWVVYALDRWADVSQAPQRAERHLYLWQDHRPEGIMMLIASIATLTWIALWRLPEVALWHGLGLGVAAALYLASHSLPGQGPWRRLVYSIAGLAALLFISQLEILHLAKIVLSVLVLGFMLTLAVASVRPRLRQLLPKEMLASLLLALACSLIPHMGSLGDHSLLCTETVLVWVLFAMNLAAIAAGEKAAQVADAAAEQIAQRWTPPSFTLTGLLMMGYTGYQAAIGEASLYILSVTVSAACLSWLGMTPDKRGPDVQRTLADLALAVPAVGYCLAG